jgi:hypothetical protein
MRAEIFWVGGVPQGRLAVLPRPRGGDWLGDEVRSLRASGVDVLVSLLTQEEVEELDVVGEAGCCAASGIEFVSFPFADRGVPASASDALALVRRLAAFVLAGKAVAVHCRQGVGPGCGLCPGLARRKAGRGVRAGRRGQGLFRTGHARAEGMGAAVRGEGIETTQTIGDVCGVRATGRRLRATPRPVHQTGRPEQGSPGTIEGACRLPPSPA